MLTIKSDPRKSILLGIKNNQFYIVYQPVVNAQTLRISGVEVLMRWRHPVVGEIPPDVFINLAETQQMIVPLTHHLLALIASDAAVLKRILPRGVKLGLNISPAHLQADSFRDDMLRFAAALPADHFHVVLEVTERAMIDKDRSRLCAGDWHRNRDLAGAGCGTDPQPPAEINDRRRRGGDPGTGGVASRPGRSFPAGVLDQPTAVAGRAGGCAR